MDGVEIRRDSLVRLRPSRRADAQDLFYAGQVARVTAVLGDVDGGWHVAVVLVDDPAADLHEWYGRYLYFAPDELEPIADTGKKVDHANHRNPDDGRWAGWCWLGAIVLGVKSIPDIQRYLRIRRM